MRPTILTWTWAMLFLTAASAQAQDLAGSWPNGTWTDFNSGHTGPLRGQFRPTANGNYRVVFTGRFAKIVPFRYATTLNVVRQDGDKTYMSGESRLPFFGRFTYDAVADPYHFNSQYNSRRYQGEFNLYR